MEDWAKAFGGFGSFAGGLGTLYGAYNGNKLANASIDLTKQQNQLMLDKYNRDQKDKESMNNSFASVWGDNA